MFQKKQQIKKQRIFMQILPNPIFSLSAFSTMSDTDSAQLTVNNGGSYVDPPELHSLDQLRGTIAQAARNPRQCEFLEKIVTEGNEDQIGKIYSEIKPLLCNLAVHNIGHNLLKKMIARVDEDKLTEIVEIFTGVHSPLDEISTEYCGYGSFVILALVERLQENEYLQSLLISKLSKTIFSLMTSNNSQKIITHYISSYSSEIVEPLRLMIALNLVQLAFHKHGNYALIDCLVAMSEQFRNDLGSTFMRCVYTVATNAKLLSGHSSGNYVLQCVIKFRNELANLAIALRLTGKYVELSLDKHGCHVVRELIINSDLEVSGYITSELFSRHEDTVRLCEDKFGNHVVQAAMGKTRDPDIEKKIKKATVNMTITQYSQTIIKLVQR